MQFHPCQNMYTYYGRDHVRVSDIMSGVKYACSGTLIRHVARGGSVGSDEPPSQIKGPLFQRKGPLF